MPRKTEPRVITEQQVFPTRLRELMEEHGTTQKELAAAIGMRPQTVSLYTGGQSAPDINCLYKIAEYFDVTSDWLIGRPNSTKTIKEDIQAACKTTGLSQSAVYFLEFLKDSSNSKYKNALTAINLLLAEEKVGENIDFWARIFTYFDAADKPFTTLLSTGEEKFAADDVLPVLLAVNNKYLERLRDEWKKKQGGNNNGQHHETD